MLKSALAASATVAAIAALSSPVYANNTSATITVNGTVGAQCSMDLTSQSVSIPDISDSNGRVYAAALAVNALSGGGDFWCNGANSKLTLNGTPFTNAGFTGTAPSGFTNVVNWSLSGTMGTTPIAYDTAHVGGTDQEYPVGIFDSNNPSGQLSADASSDRLIAGDYSATLTLTLTPGT
jgi:hypothetical protein